MIPDANNGVATAEVNTLVGDLVENHRREVHTPVVGEKRKGTKTATALKKLPCRRMHHLKGTVGTQECQLQSCTRQSPKKRN